MGRDTVEDFLEECVEQTDHPHDVLCLDVVHAHYKLYCEKLDKRPWSKKTLSDALFERGYEPELDEREDQPWIYYRLWIEHPEEKPAEHHEHPQERVVKGQFSLRVDLSFAGGEVMKAGTVVDWLKPNPDEKRVLQQCFERDKESYGSRAKHWFLVRWNGKSRRVPSYVLEPIYQP